MERFASKADFSASKLRGHSFYKKRSNELYDNSLAR